MLQYVAEEILKAEGFTDVKYVKVTAGTGQPRLWPPGRRHHHELRGTVHLRVDAGDPVVILAGVHMGCFELFGTERVRSIRDLKGKTVALQELGSTQHVFLASMAAHVGLDPRKDIDSTNIPAPRPSGCWRRERSTPTWAFRQTHRSSAPGRSVTSSSTARSTGRGRSTSAAWSPVTGSSFASIPWPPSGRCGRS